MAADKPYADGRRLDVRVPVSARPGLPVVVLLHGCCGDRSDVVKLAESVAGSGAVVMSLTGRVLAWWVASPRRTRTWRAPSGMPGPVRRRTGGTASAWSSSGGLMGRWRPPSSHSRATRWIPTAAWSTRDRLAQTRWSAWPATTAGRFLSLSRS